MSSFDTDKEFPTGQTHGRDIDGSVMDALLLMLGVQYQRTICLLSQETSLSESFSNYHCVYSLPTNVIMVVSRI